MNTIRPTDYLFPLSQLFFMRVLHDKKKNVTKFLNDTFKKQEESYKSTFCKSFQKFKFVLFHK